MQNVKKEKKVDESALTISQAMLPQDANPAGNVHGGVIMKLIDTVAGVTATLKRWPEL